MDFSLSEELVMVRDMARDFVTNELLPLERKVLVRETGSSRGAPIPVEERQRLRKLAVDQGLWAMGAPENLGGGGLSTLGLCLVAEELGKTFVDFDFGDIPPILFEANPEQQAAFLAPAIAGENECVLALLEPDSTQLSGENGRFQCRATRHSDGWKLNGVKRVDAPCADTFLVLAQADEGATWFILEGVELTNGRLLLQDTPVPAENVLGEVGGAFRLGAKYRNGRLIRAAARKVGIADRLLELSWQYARDWKSLGQSLAVRPAVQRAIAETVVDIDAARWLVLNAASEIDDGKPAKEAALRASLFAAEMVRRAIDRTVQVYGGPGQSADQPLLRIYSSVVNPRESEQVLELQRWQITNNLITLQ